MNHKEWQKNKEENHGENSRTQETKKIYLPAGGVVKITHDKQHRPEIEIFDNKPKSKPKPNSQQLSSKEKKKQYIDDIFTISEDFFAIPKR